MLHSHSRALLATAAALALTLQACSTDTTPAPSAPGTAPETAATGSVETTTEVTEPASDDTQAAPSRTPTARVTSRPGATADAILDGRRQVVIRPVDSSESIVVVDGAGRLTLTDGPTDTGLFVLTPSGNRHLIRTARAGAGGEPSCMGLKTNGSDSLTIEAAPCDAGRAGQLFSIQRRSGRDAGGRPVYSLSSGGAYLQVSDQGGLIAEELGDGAATGFSFVDNGAATLPKLGD